MHDRATLPPMIRDFMMSEEYLEVDGVSYRCFLLSRSGKLAEQSPPRFAGQVMHEGRRLFIVADDVPAELRRFLLMQEIVEFEQLDARPDRCVNAIKRVLREVPAVLEPAFLAFDREFYATMVPWAVEHEYPADLIAEMRKALAFLESATA